jgi:hypothetical protein
MLRHMLDRSEFFLTVKALGRVFRGLHTAFTSGIYCETTFVMSDRFTWSF